ncbi:MAG TPA: DinB family protein [Virgibacillus sp.]|nr:DinB family protein [Virgibacillus sp.]
MNEEQIFKQINLVRQSTLGELEGLSEEQADQIPDGFRNNIRWNLGHIYVVQNVLLTKFGGKKIDTPERYLELFAPGTKPADWEGDVPKLAELKEQLEKQPEKLKETLTGQLDDKAAEAFNTLSTVGEILNFTLYHEGLHAGTIKGLKHAANATK